MGSVSPVQYELDYLDQIINALTTIRDNIAEGDNYTWTRTEYVNIVRTFEVLIRMFEMIKNRLTTTSH